MKTPQILWLIVSICSLSLTACSAPPKTVEQKDSSISYDVTTVHKEETTEALRTTETASTASDESITEELQAVSSETNSWDEPFDIRVANQDALSRSNLVSSIDEIENIYSAEDIIPQIQYCRTYNFLTFQYEMEKNYPIEYYVTPENNAPYCVYRLDTGSKMFVFFNEEKDGLGDVVYFFVVDQILEKEDFSALKQGMTLSDVEATDPGTKSIDTLNVFSLFKHFTLHMVKGGFVKITYEGGDFCLDNNSTIKIEDPNEFVITDITFIPNGEAIPFPDPYERNESVDMHFSVLDSDY